MWPPGSQPCSADGVRKAEASWISVWPRKGSSHEDEEEVFCARQVSGNAPFAGPVLPPGPWKPPPRSRSTRPSGSDAGAGLAQSLARRGLWGTRRFPVSVRVFTGGPWLTHGSVPQPPCSSCSGGSGGPGRAWVSPAAVRRPPGLLPGAGSPSDGRQVCVASLKGCGGRPAGRGEAVPDQGAMGRDSGRPGGLGHVLKLRAPSHAFCSVRKSRARPEHPGRAHAPAAGGRAGSGFHGGPTTEDPRRW